MSIKLLTRLPASPGSPLSPLCPPEGPYEAKPKTRQHCGCTEAH